MTDQATLTMASIRQREKQADPPTSLVSHNT
jgi:hypothetical protein